MSSLEEYTHELEMQLSVKSALLDEAIQLHQSLETRLLALEEDAQLEAFVRQTNEAWGRAGVELSATCRDRDAWRERAGRLEEENCVLRDVVLERVEESDKLRQLVLEVQHQIACTPWSEKRPLSPNFAYDQDRHEFVQQLTQQLKEANQKIVLLEDQLRLRSGAEPLGPQSLAPEVLPDSVALLPDAAWAAVGLGAADRLTGAAPDLCALWAGAGGPRGEGGGVNVATGGTLPEIPEAGAEPSEAAAAAAGGEAPASAPAAEAGGWAVAAGEGASPAADAFEVVLQDDEYPEAPPSARAAAAAMAAPGQQAGIPRQLSEAGVVTMYKPLEAELHAGGGRAAGTLQHSTMTPVGVTWPQAHPEVRVAVLAHGSANPGSEPEVGSLGSFGVAVQPGRPPSPRTLPVQTQQAYSLHPRNPGVRVPEEARRVSPPRICGGGQKTVISALGTTWLTSQRPTAGLVSPTTSAATHVYHPSSGATTTTAALSPGAGAATPSPAPSAPAPAPAASPAAGPAAGPVTGGVAGPAGPAGALGQPPPPVSPAVTLRQKSPPAAVVQWRGGSAAG